MNQLRSLFARVSKSSKAALVLNKYNSLFQELEQRVPGNRELNKLKAFKAAVESEKYTFDPDSKTKCPKLDRELPESAGVDSYISNLFVIDEATETSGRPSLRMANQKEKETSSSFVIGSKSGAEEVQISDLLKMAKTLATKSKAAQNGLLKDLTPLAICPEVGMAERYHEMREYDKYPGYIPDYIKSRALNYLIPQIIDNLDADKQKHIISLLSFSMGGSEVIMMQTALRRILEDEVHLSKEIVDIAMSDVNAILVGYAPKLEAFYESGFNKMVIFSLDDRGVLVPEGLCDEQLARKSISGTGAFIKQLGTGQINLNCLFVGGEPLTTENDNSLDPTITDYTDFIKFLPSGLQELIGDCYYEI